MNIVITIVALVVLATGIYFNQRDLAGSETDTPSIEKEVLSENATPTPDLKKEKEILVEEVIPTKAPTVTTEPIQKPDVLESFKYPNANVISTTGVKIFLESKDSPDAITDWYKDRINAEGMSVTSFVTTNTNNNVLNKLVGSSGVKKVSVEITKKEGVSAVNISVELSS